MKSRHRLRPQLSATTRAKPSLVNLAQQIADAKRRGDQATVERLETEKAWLVMNSVLP